MKSALNLWRASAKPTEAKPIFLEWHKQLARCQLLAIKVLPDAPWEQWLSRHFTSMTYNCFAPLMSAGSKTDFRKASREQQVALVIQRARTQTAAALAADIRRQPIHSSINDFITFCLDGHLEAAPALPFFRLANDFSSNPFRMTRDEALREASLLLPALREGISALGGDEADKAKVLRAVFGRGVLLQVVAAFFLAAYHGVRFRH